jgi:hypothetical protein
VKKDLNAGHDAGRTGRFNMIGKINHEELTYPTPVPKAGF